VVPLIESKQVEPVVARYLNRLSDFLFVAARSAAQAANRPETIYKRVSIGRARREREKQQ
jgi:cob(I)alamin adenosyltransferase